jgi:hypothetical protein
MRAAWSDMIISTYSHSMPSRHPCQNCPKAPHIVKKRVNSKQTQRDELQPAAWPTQCCGQEGSQQDTWMGDGDEKSRVACMTGAGSSVWMNVCSGRRRGVSAPTPSMVVTRPDRSSATCFIQGGRHVCLQPLVRKQMGWNNCKTPRHFSQSDSALKLRSIPCYVQG